ncbi:MAG: type II toxin-antitoxin system VapB family antitoxin [Thermoanaerobaculia bacterium]
MRDQTDVDILMPHAYVLMRMRTTVRLDPHLLTEAKRVAASSGKTLTAVIDEALRESLGRRRAPHAVTKRKLPTFRGQGLQPGVNLDDSAALLELMEGDRDSDRRQRSDLRAPRRRR